MPENYDDLFEEMESEPTAEGEPQSGPQSKEEFAARMKAARDNLTELANQTEGEIAGDGGTFQRYLDTLSRFERYSAQNTLLIFAQRPDAAQLGDYDRWKEAGTPVSRGMTGISIFEPGKEYKREDGSTGVSMNIKKVFDVSQTSSSRATLSSSDGKPSLSARSAAPPLPTRSGDLAGAPDRNKLQPEPVRNTRTLLKALMSSSPAPIRPVDSVQEGVGARYNEQRGVIEVVRGLDGDSLFRCLSQEIAYAGLDRRDTGALPCNDKGFAAYAASYALCTKYGMDTKGYDFAEVPEYFAGRDGKEVRGEIKTIRDTVNDVATRMARELEPPEKKAQAQEARA